MLGAAWPLAAVASRAACVLNLLLPKFLSGSKGVLVQGAPIALGLRAGAVSALEGAAGDSDTSTSVPKLATTAAGVLGDWTAAPVFQHGLSVLRGWFQRSWTC